MTLPATQDIPRGWGFGPMPPPVVVEPKIKREPMHIVRASEFARRKAQAVLLLHGGNLRQNDITAAMGWPSGSTWRVLTSLIDNGLIEVVSRNYRGVVYGVRRSA